MKAKEFEAATLPKGTRKNFVFTTKEDVGNIVADDNGAYLVTASAIRQFNVNVNWSEDKLEVQGLHMDSSGEFYFKKRVGRAYETFISIKIQFTHLVGITAKVKASLVCDN